MPPSSPSATVATAVLLLLVGCGAEVAQSSSPSPLSSFRAHLLPGNSVQGSGGINDYTTNSYDMSGYVNPNDTYVASEEVKQGADISSGEFERNREYFQDGASTPVVLFAVGVLALILFNICLCCGIAKLCATHHTIMDNTVSCGEFFNRILFGIFIIICFLATHILYLGYSDVVDGFDILRTSTTKIGSGFDAMNMDIASLTVKSDDLLLLCAPYGCSAPAESVDKGVDYMSDDLGKIPDYVEDVNNGIDMLEDVVTLLMFVMYGSLIIAIILYVLVQLCCKTQACGAICCGNISFFIVALIGVMWMIITSVTADFCYENPTLNTLNSLKASKGQMYLVWYSSCYSGFNPVHRYINHTHFANEDVIAFVGGDTSPQAQQILNQASQIKTNLDLLTRSTIGSCSPVQDGWLSMMNEGICGSFYEGVRVIWICEVAACISLFFMMVTGGIIGRTAKDNAISVRPVASAGDDLEFVDNTPRGEKDVVQLQGTFQVDGGGDSNSHGQLPSMNF